jgi:hypothetical protein
MQKGLDKPGCVFLHTERFTQQLTATIRLLVMILNKAIKSIKFSWGCVTLLIVSYLVYINHAILMYSTH